MLFIDAHERRQVLLEAHLSAKDAIIPIASGRQVTWFEAKRLAPVSRGRVSNMDQPRKPACFESIIAADWLLAPGSASLFGERVCAMLTPSRILANSFPCSSGSTTWTIGRVSADIRSGALADDLSDRSPADRSRVSVSEEWEVRYWCRMFGCTGAELRAAVRKAGVMTDHVRIALEDR